MYEIENLISKAKASSNANVLLAIIGRAEDIWNIKYATNEAKPTKTFSDSDLRAQARNAGEEAILEEFLA